MRNTCYFCGIGEVIDEIELNRMHVGFCKDCQMEAFNAEMECEQECNEQAREQAERDNYDRYRY